MTYAKDASGPFYHGTRADLAPSDLLAPGHASNYAMRNLSWTCFSGTLDAAMQTLFRHPRERGDPVAVAARDEPTGFPLSRE